MIQCTLIDYVTYEIPSACWASTRYPGKVLFKGIPFIDEEHDKNGRYCEDNNYEEVA